MYLHTAQGFVEPRAIASLILGVRHGIFMGQFNIQISDYFSHKNVTFTLQVMKSQANIIFPSKYHFPVSIFYC